jgi:hydroxyacylglutathione hydrolase
MKIERFEIPGLAQYSYLISSEGEAVVIDAIRDIDRYLQYASENNLVIRYILETHIHADFAAGSSALAAATEAQLALSAYDANELYQSAMPHRKLFDGDAITIGEARIQALHTPGHTPEHLSFLLFDTARSASEPLALFSGDFLFVGSLGRPDLLGQRETNRLAHLLYQSLHGPLASLPNGLQIYPGHGAGSLCGSGMSERVESTLGYERATNPLFRLSEEAFIARILGSLPELPVYYPRMKQLNSAGAPGFEILPGHQPLTPQQVNDLRAKPDTILLDLRRPEAFGGAHIPDSINIGCGQNLSLWAGWLLDPKKQIILIGNGTPEEETRRALVRIGLDNIVGYLDKGMASWIETGLPFSHISQMSVCDVVLRPSELFVLDVRSPEEWRQGHIDNAHHISLGDLPQHLDQLPKHQPIVTVCGSGYRSSIAASLLQHHGFEDIRSMNGGMSAWNRQDCTSYKLAA